VLGECLFDLKKMYLGGENKEQWFNVKKSEVYFSFRSSPQLFT
jgi:hypothetical protein